MQELSIHDMILGRSQPRMEHYYMEFADARGLEDSSDNLEESIDKINENWDDVRVEYYCYGTTYDVPVYKISSSKSQNSAFRLIMRVGLHLGLVPKEFLFGDEGNILVNFLEENKTLPSQMQYLDENDQRVYENVSDFYREKARERSQQKAEDIMDNNGMVKAVVDPTSQPFLSSYNGKNHYNIFPIHGETAYRVGS